MRGYPLRPCAATGNSAVCERLQPSLAVEASASDAVGLVCTDICDRRGRTGSQHSGLHALLDLASRPGAWVHENDVTLHVALLLLPPVAAQLRVAANTLHHNVSSPLHWALKQRIAAVMRATAGLESSPPAALAMLSELKFRVSVRLSVCSTLPSSPADRERFDGRHCGVTVAQLQEL